MASTNTVVDSFTTQNQIDSYLNTLSKKYLANNEYIVSGTNTGFVSAGIDAIAPYANLTNRYYPTAATLPNDSTNLRTKGELGGYFIPSNLGASVYLTKNITYSLNTGSIQSGKLYNFIDPTLYNKGRGLTQTDQDNIISHIVNNDWMKFKHSSPSHDGNITLTEVYQKFIPYQSHYESTRSDSNGVVNTRDDFEFWTGPQKSTWNPGNSAFPLTKEKYFDLASRIDSLVLTPGLELYTWNSDIFGNQYALYKPLQSSLYAATTATGQLYVKTVDGTINVAPTALELIYNKHKNQSFYGELISNNLVNAEVFFDTLVIQLSSTVLYEKINYNYEDYRIESASQSFLPLKYTSEQSISNTLTLSNALSTSNLHNWGTPGVSAITYYGGNWYISSQKTITICTLLSSTLTYNSGVSSLIVPVLYTLDLNKPENRVRVYPNQNTDFTEYIYPLNNGRSVDYMEAPVFTYNEDTKSYITTFITFSGNDAVVPGSANQELFLLSYKVKA